MLTAASYYDLSPFHQRCYEVGFGSNDRKLRYGAVLVRAHQVIGRGCNYTPTGYDCAQCPRVLDRSIKSGTQLERCYAIHAEQAALADAAHAGRPTQGAALWVLGILPDNRPLLLEAPVFSCSICARVAYAFRVAEIVVATVAGPAVLTIDEALGTSFAVAEGRREAR